MADMSEREFAAAMKSSLSTVQNRIRRGLMPRSAKKVDGHWRIDLKVGRLEFEAAESLRVKGTDAEELLAARARREKAMAALAELELLEREGKLCLAAEVSNGMAETFRRCRDHLLAIPTRAKQQLPHLAVSDLALLDALIREALEELANPSNERIYGSESDNG